ncbi:hypothetical protein [Xanthocytophaga flava]|uniref:Uncharacterized protein n=1 Tax=Xanthocytophaga agilis TaxID=3048010 RepID=A0AAE3R353_9BACT|nr:hypothetical protein [Xanthocytophaga flavus]MDJ1471605.1 hypothetical protein [Xanthocytophaga flavus]MDJ1502874.1 hypothetical protein [Xanthocytophaga agilis]
MNNRDSLSASRKIKVVQKLFGDSFKLVIALIVGIYICLTTFYILWMHPPFKEMYDKKTVFPPTHKRVVSLLHQKS